MGTYIVRRTVEMAIAIFGVLTVTFIIVRLVPGDPARLMEPPGTPESVIKMIRHQLGTDRPLEVQYADYLTSLARGDMGNSFRGSRPVGPLVWKALPNTLALGGISILVATILAALLGISSALRSNSLFDRAVLALVSLAVATPNFWLGVMLVLIFAIQLRWLPAIDMTGPSSFVLPVITLTFTLLPVLVRTIRQNFLETMGEDYVRAARARGVREARVILIHVMKVAAIPLITLIGLQAGYVLGGAVVVESIFNWPGVGFLALTAIQDRDFPVIQGTILVIAIVFTLVNFMVDLTYAALDPRIKY